MSNLPPPPPPPPPGAGRGPRRANKPERPAPKNKFQPEGSKSGDGGDSKPGFPRWGWWIIGLVALGALLVPSLWPSNDGESLDYSSFIEQVEDGNVESVEVNKGSGKITGEFTNGDTFNTTAGGEAGLFEGDQQFLEDEGVTITYKAPSNNFLLNLLGFMLPIFLIIGFLIWMQRRAAGQMGGVMSIGKSKAKAYTTDKPSTTFEDIAGYEGVKQEISEVVDFLRYPDRFKEIGARVPKGMLLVGPPGTGKTLFARAVAGEAGVGFLSVTGSDFMEMFVGVGASRVRDLFQQARRMGRAIIFIDEIDSIGRKRGAGLGGGHDEREQTLNQLLVEMDGFDQRKAIIMLAATNRPDILDPALLRPGRFDRQIIVDRPDLHGREAILKIHSRGKPLADDIDLRVLARQTPGFTGADLANLVNEAALLAARFGKKEISQDELAEAIDRVIAGPERKTKLMSEKERTITAYHESGHAIVGHALPHNDPVHKITIIPRGRAGGYTMALPTEDRSYNTKGELTDKLAMMLGGRVAEELKIGDITTGASNDIQKATGLAREMVTQYGMSDRLGPILLGQKESQPFLGRDFGHTADYSGQVAEQIDLEIRHLLDLAHDEALMVLVENDDVLEEMGQALLEEETLEGDRLADILSRVRERPSRAAAAPEGMDPGEVVRLLRRYDSSTLNGVGTNGHRHNGSGHDGARDDDQRDESPETVRVGQVGWDVGLGGMLDAPDGPAEDEDASRRETVGEAIADEVVEDDGASDTPDQR